MRTKNCKLALVLIAANDLWSNRRQRLTRDTQPSCCWSNKTSSAAPAVCTGTYMGKGVYSLPRMRLTFLTTPLPTCCRRGVVLQKCQKMCVHDSFLGFMWELIFRVHVGMCHWFNLWFLCSQITAPLTGCIWTKLLTG